MFIKCLSFIDSSLFFLGKSQLFLFCDILLLEMSTAAGRKWNQFLGDLTEFLKYTYFLYEDKGTNLK